MSRAGKNTVAVESKNGSDDHSAQSEIFVPQSVPNAPVPTGHKRRILLVDPAKMTSQDVRNLYMVLQRSDVPNRTIHVNDMVGKVGAKKEAHARKLRQYNLSKAERQLARAKDRDLKFLKQGRIPEDVVTEGKFHVGEDEIPTKKPDMFESLREYLSSLIDGSSSWFAEGKRTLSDLLSHIVRKMASVFAGQAFEKWVIVLLNFVVHILSGEATPSSMAAIAVPTVIALFGENYGRHALMVSVVTNIGLSVYEYFTNRSGEEIVTEGWLVDSTQQLKTWFSFVWNSEILSIVKVGLVQLAAFRWFSYDTAMKIQSHLCDSGKLIKMNTADLLTWIFDSLHKIAILIENVMVGVPISEAFALMDPVAYWNRRYEEVVLKSMNAYPGLPVEGCWSEEQVLAALLEVSIGFNSLMKRGIVPKRYSKDIKEKVEKLISLSNEFTTKVSNKMRLTPIAFVVGGPAKVGKSYFIRFMYSRVFRYFGIEYTDDKVYPREYTQDFWEGYNPLSHLAVRYSEIGGASDNIASQQGDKAVMEMCSLADNLAKQVPMAFDGKGKTPFLARVIGADSNNVSSDLKGDILNLSKSVSNVGAVLRRLVIVYIKPREEYKLIDKDGNKIDAIDYDKCNDGSRFFDRIHICVTQGDGGNPRSLTRHEKFSGYIDMFTAWWDNYIKNHFEQQYALKAQFENAMKNELYGIKIDGSLDLKVFCSAMERELPDLFNEEKLKEKIATFKFSGIDVTLPENFAECITNYISNYNIPDAKKLLIAELLQDKINALLGQVDEDICIEEKKQELEHKVDYGCDDLPNAYTEGNGVEQKSDVLNPRVEMEEKEMPQDKTLQFLCSERFHIFRGEYSPIGFAYEFLALGLDVKKIYAHLTWYECRVHAAGYSRYIKKEIETKPAEAWETEAFRKTSEFIYLCKKIARDLYLLKRYGKAYFGIPTLAMSIKDDFKSYVYWPGKVNHFTSFVKYHVDGFKNDWNGLFSDIWDVASTGAIAGAGRLAKWKAVSAKPNLDARPGLAAILGSFALLWTGNVSGALIVVGLAIVWSYCQLHLHALMVVAADKAIATADDQFTMAKNKLRSRFGWSTEQLVRNSLIVGGVVLAFAALSKFFSAISKDIGTEGIFASAITEVEEKANAGNSYPRIANKVVSSWNSVQVIQSTGHPGTEEQALNALKFNVRKVTLIGKFNLPSGIEERKYSMHGLGSKDIIFVPSHLVDHVIDGVLEIHHPDGNKPTQAWKYNKDEVVFLGNDLAAIFQSAVRFADIDHWFTDVNRDGIIATIASQKVILNLTPKILCGDTLTGIKVVRENWYKYRGDHYSGKCGIPAVAKIGTLNTILGIHVAGDRKSDAAYVVPINKEHIKVVRDHIKNKFSNLIPLVGKTFVTYSDSLMDEVVTEGTISKLPLEVEAPVPRSVVRYLDLQHIQYAGKLKGNVLAKEKSRLRPTPWKGDLYELFDTCGMSIDKFYAKPVMSAIKGAKGEEWIDPIKINLKGMDRPNKPLNKRILNEIVKVKAEHILEILRESKEELKIAPLKMSVAINGMGEDKILRRMDMSKAAGFGFPGKKKDYFEDEEGLRVPVDEVETEVKTILDSYVNGISYPHIFKGTLKDEPRSEKKVKEGKTRLFFASSLAHLIVQRMFLAPIFTLMLEFPKAFDSGIGIDMHREGNRVINHFAEFAKKPTKDFFNEEEICEGDHEGFDQGPPVDITWAAYSIVSYLAKSLGYNDYAMKILNTMLSDLLDTVFVLYGEVFTRPGIFPSGQYGTAEVNCLRNDVMMRYIYYDVVGDHESFDKMCKPLYYGDDLLMYVIHEMRSKYNTTVIAEKCRSLFGTGFTTASKQKEVQDFIPVKDMSFLKRGFRDSEVLGRIVCPLEVSSLFKTLSFYMPSNAPDMTKENQWLQAIQSVLRELVFHLTSQMYEQFRQGIAALYLTHVGIDVMDRLDSFDTTVASLEVAQC